MERRQKLIVPDVGCLEERGGRGEEGGRGAGLATKEVKFQLQKEGEDPRKGSSEGPFHRSTPQSADTSVPTSPLPESVVRRYGNLPGVLHMMELEKGETGLGLSLAGNRDRSRMSVFVVGIDPGGAAGRDGRMTVGDELLEVRPGRSLPHTVPRPPPRSRLRLCPRSTGRSCTDTATRTPPPSSRAPGPRSRSSSSGAHTSVLRWAAVPQLHQQRALL